MGCDIHCFVEVKYKDAWKFAGEVNIERFYDLFAKMANVRNEDKEIEPISNPRGVPDDVDDLTRLIMDDEDLHSHSYLTLAEFKMVDEWWYSLSDEKKLYRFNPIDLPYSVMEDNFKPKYNQIKDIRFVFAFDN